MCYYCNHNVIFLFLNYLNLLFYFINYNLFITIIVYSVKVDFSTYTFICTHLSYILKEYFHKIICTFGHTNKNKCIKILQKSILKML
ncbi:hypothetical protein C923_04274 [Plasmodium falciparum UGT5.1]|uniref:Uncharacterized protein n=7 Tax=Plasmodium falciparum TaxID=5833 RepID=W4J2D6_PLAFP|nr:hypothetical protein PFTANZ_04174 [Plasmodium falciparum Tanzania (2000708)]ETW41378.1 hypothetical protein PFNF135_04364 [Plasmodium falciparum NF135/5.C10]ETW47888.1 hypothetical protein PFMALIP_04076 [Plasmodium falciparum MaliPS096_E11]ETW55782.1 hypothetical protein PFUGPA_02226 [Plasmodium falciparum Palo Alto/Uganda]ETW60004.1 hypothetical protein PFMC_04180 [Plasmodium falciparum CAMP/Malaysia]EUR67467.1 hypothetical protein PFBG_04147 [Plasmodium falciparum 7G8]EWC75045.1 hypothet